ncbi:3-oxoacyl-[acyl-carrier-protein] reductase [Thermovenabulum gondwanense]|uniref:3-oxoacyl-[acyl-carrier-protein] reductase n=1 Tax=Thermovenabulum gondwanense TaxID=520767 RepID=A0A162MNC1_9FIRM|nr:3-oxoacyl-[acyl-carrier-protein] reductase [Thermovenabulum gondwanense]KYO66778.1 3-oxoacyl-[acyl-carrier-protein] reductase FabG [Thermovenabulum gondwanense]
MNLQGKIAIVTGGSRGIGKSICMKLAEKGCNVVINYVKNESFALEVAREIENMGQSAYLVKKDVSKIKEAEELIEEVYKKFNNIDILVNNAGITKDTLFLRMTEEDFDKVLDTNLKGTFNVTKAAVKYMVKKRFGRIINISSIVGIYGNAGQVNYAAAKAGIIGFTKSLAKELGSRGITVNAVAPGFIKTDMTTPIIEKETEEKIIERIPLKRIGLPEDVANLVAFLASDEASYITGQVIAIDGGLTL